MQISRYLDYTQVSKLSTEEATAIPVIGSYSGETLLHRSHLDTNPENTVGDLPWYSAMVC
jgi:hypothetical protein